MTTYQFLNYPVGDEAVASRPGQRKPSQGQAEEGDGGAGEGRGGEDEDTGQYYKGTVLYFLKGVGG